jgi:hypothetical protein
VLTGNLALRITNAGRRSQTIRISDNAYGYKPITKKVSANSQKTIVLNL